jgi:glucosamine kinase
MADGDIKNTRKKVNYILGVDGGGTKTIARLVNLTTEEQWQAASGPSSLSNDFTGAVNVLNTLIDELIRKANCQLLEVVSVFGLAGACNANAVTKLQQIFAHRFISLDIYSDAITSAYGANNGDEVVIVALGTGSVGMRLQLNDQGELTEKIVGGWGFFIGDEGGGAKLGYHSVQALVTEFQHFGYAKSKLAQAVATFINTSVNKSSNNKSDYNTCPDISPDTSYGTNAGINLKGNALITRQSINTWLAAAKPVDFAELSPLVTHYQFDCVVAKKLITNHVESVEALINDTRTDTKLPVVLLGGLAQYTQTLLSTTIQGFLISPKGDALDGACLLASMIVKK